MLYMPGVSCNIIVVMVDAVAVHAKTFYLDISVMMVDAVNALTYIISVMMLDAVNALRYIISVMMLDAVNALTYITSVMMLDAVNALTYIISVVVGVVENRVAGDLVVNFDCFEQQRCYFFFCHTTIQVSWKQNSC